jgi:type II restriction enzyme
MPVNLDKPQQWKADITKSVAMYNEWFMRFAPEAFRTTRVQTTKDVESALHATATSRTFSPLFCVSTRRFYRRFACPPAPLSLWTGSSGLPDSRQTSSSVWSWRRNSLAA